MSGGKGGGGSSSKSTTTIKQSKPSPVTLPTSPWGPDSSFTGLGFTMPQNPMQMGSAATGQGLTPPAWAASGSPFAMDWWGQQAPNVGAAMLQQQGWGQWAPPPAPGTDGTGGAGDGTGACPTGQRMGRGGTCVPITGGSTGSKASGGKGSSGGKAPRPACAEDDYACQIRQLQRQMNNMPDQSWASHGTQG